MDMLLCAGEGCPLRSDCHRHRRRSHGRQVWLAQPPFEPSTGDCRMFSPVDALAPTPEQIRARAYSIWQSRGCPTGHSEAHWLAAESELNAAFRGRLRPPQDTSEGG